MRRPVSHRRRFSVVVESLPVPLGTGAPGQTSRVPLAVEAVTYRGDFAAGEAILATRLPDPE